MKTPEEIKDIVRATFDITTESSEHNLTKHYGWLHAVFVAANQINPIVIGNALVLVDEVEKEMRDEAKAAKPHQETITERLVKKTLESIKK